MKHLSLVAALLMVVSLISCTAPAGNETAFWKWFASNEARLFTFERDQEAIFDEIGAEMHRVNSDLTFEFGPVQNGKREFVISAGGIKSAFPAVEALYSSAPELRRWVWVKYRPRRFSINDLELNGKRIKADEVTYLLARDGDKVGIVLFFEGYSDEEKSTYGQMGYLFLDEALGEFAVESQVGFIEFQASHSKYFSQSRPLKELPAQFDEYWGRRVH
jgi:hypothetical protein